MVQQPVGIPSNNRASATLPVQMRPIPYQQPLVEPPVAVVVPKPVVKPAVPPPKPRLPRQKLPRRPVVPVDPVIPLGYLPDVGLIVGGADCVWKELKQAQTLCEYAGLAYQMYVVNDHIAAFPPPATGVTLHPDKLKGWLETRRQAGLAPLLDIWAHRDHKQVTKALKDWGGSVGLLAVRVALTKGHRKVICCGIPMQADIKHFQRGVPWAAARQFLPGWNTHLEEIKPYVRSMSGWTAEQLGRPDDEWLVVP